MTNREFFNAIATSNLDATLVDFAKDAIAKLDARNDARKNTPSKAQIENAPIKASILELLEKGAKVASDIGVALGISTQKASALAKQLVEEGQLKVADIKVAKKGTVKEYSIAD